MDTILSERDACGVGFIASLEGKRTHKTVSDALRACGCMEHRGACSADNDSGDGAGIMTQIPWKLLNVWAAENGLAEMADGEVGVGMIFLPKDHVDKCKALAEEKAIAEGFEVVGWRAVPVDESIVGQYAKVTLPHIEQMFVKKAGVTGADLERELFVVRKSMEQAALASGNDSIAENFYVCNISCKTIVYKGMLRSAVVGEFYLDLKNEDYESAFSIYHRRFSTNTNPKWPLAQPMRMLGHNGEINTLLGNLNWTASKQATFSDEVWEGRESEMMPLCTSSASDSANLDRLAEFLIKSGRPIEEVIMLLVPEAYRNHPEMTEEYPEAADFYEYWEGLQEGWDGPALLVFSDGDKIGAHLDRNGLRPARFWRTSDNMIYVASEVGVLGDVITNAKNIVRKGRLGPGHILLADIENGTFKEHKEVISELASAKPYREWLDTVRKLKDLNPGKYVETSQIETETCLQLQTAHGYGQEDVQLIIESMAANGIEPTFCMGDDVPLAALSDRPQMISDYFKQRFAQVTNPPIDPLREGLVMSLEMRVGAKGNMLAAGAEAVNGQVILNSPVLIEPELEVLQADSELNTKTLPTFFKGGDLKSAVDKLCTDAEEAVKAGAKLLVLSDRMTELNSDEVAIPSLLAVGAVHHHLIAQGLRTQSSIVADTAQAFSTHHCAVLVGYGASGVCPWLALETCRQWREAPRTVTLMQRGKLPDVTVVECQHNFRKALNKGLLKIISKIGISLLSSYHGAQIFEAYGLGPEVINTSFKGSVSRVGGLSMDELAKESISLWEKGAAADSIKKIENYGALNSRPGLDYHGNNPEMAKLLHKAVREGEDDLYSVFKEHVDNRQGIVLRDFMEFDTGREAIAVEEVEPAIKIMERFCTGGMSLGAISRETHEVIAIAMNRIGGMSNSGEGGEDIVRFNPMQDVDGDGNSPTFSYLKGLKNGDSARSAIKQVASGRFGVTPQFLMEASQIEIKVAQGAKPGEGGQLPGKKVSPYIAKLRRSKPGVPLISPPPHHDIYSIEDLAQLIHDLHHINRQAKVSVKLVAEVGIGTVASGVAKANADVIQISGHDGGTGASPVSSIKHCGGPTEMGVAETHKTLVENGLRERVTLRADGGLRSGRDVLMMAALGADEYGFGTVAMVAAGCIMARVCHTNNCPVGVASQREELRARFPGTPEHVANFMLFVGEEVRQEMAALGVRSLDELIGRLDWLKTKKQPTKTQALDLSYLTTLPSNGDIEQRSSERRVSIPHDNGPMLEDELLKQAQSAIDSQGEVTIDSDIINIDRSFGAFLGGQIAKRYGDRDFKGAVNVNLTGSAGQAFGAMIVEGLNISLVGEANDYVGKGMGGGSISIAPPPGSPFEAGEQSIAGNTCLYGATGGKLFVNGRAGERFAVRNSLAEAVVEGVGDHALEYMTGGCVVCLGSAGRNIAAGMTGGLGYFYDKDNKLAARVNGEIVKLQTVHTKAGKAKLRSMVEEHVQRTGSAFGQTILDNFDTEVENFIMLYPPSEANTPEVTDDAVTEEVEESVTVQAK